MKTYDLAIVGSGMGGSMIASLNKQKDVIVFEKDTNLGGCASTFKRFGNYYNSGATTLVGYEEYHPLKKIFDKANVNLDLKKSDIAIRVLQNGKTIDRVKDFEKFLSQIDKAYPNKNNRVFWQTIKQLDEKFWKLKNVYYSKYSLSSYVKTIKSVSEIFLTFKFDLFKTASGFIKDTLGDISKEYQDFIDSQLLITLQTTSKDISLLSLALGLAYPFHDVFYVNGGMGSIFDELLKDIETHNKEEVKTITKQNDVYYLKTRKAEYRAKNVILNSTIYDSSKLFENEKIKSYYNKFLFNDQSAFVIHMTINKKEDLLHHYQIILENEIPNAISNSYFVSLSSSEDRKMSENGINITISTHTKARFWSNLNKDEYKRQKFITEEFIINSFLENFDNITKEDIQISFSGTAKTFNRFINRNNCGGKAITLKTLLQVPSCRTPFEGLYNVGDTIFAGQGWPGVALGVNILKEELDG
ncbi:carotene isomerase [Arcobacter sp. CECT 8989]|uniref:phytoene desaturase family protein n=1 Tax=Arcobacter sp. CECT 8989 TaxID=2044509 RepID=UPI00100B992B|nr:NAD(P)-binding protein [Arcobacter sp. CECT 8989]RXJ99394.1 carotene isomerase [Arcobacter sp. CECT 8989]